MGSALPVYWNETQVSPGTRSGLGLLRDSFCSAPLLLGLTHIEDVQGQPVEKGVADQLGEEQT